MGWADAIGAVATVAGAVLGGIANQNAAEEAGKAAKKGAKTTAEYIDKGVNLLEGVREQGAPAVSYLRNVVAAKPGTLEPWQEQAVTESRQQTLRGVPSSLRGSGRFLTSAIRNVETGVRNDFLARNRARQDESARALSSPYFNLAARQGDYYATQGEHVGGAVADAGLYKANAGLANANLYGQSAGNIGGYLAGVFSEGGTVTPNGAPPVPAGPQPGQAMADIRSVIAARRSSPLRSITA